MYMCECMYVYMYMFACMYDCRYICMYVCMYVYVCVTVADSRVGKAGPGPPNQIYTN